MTSNPSPTDPIKLEPSAPPQGSPPLTPSAPAGGADAEPPQAPKTQAGAPQAAQGAKDSPKPGVKPDAPALTPPPAGAEKPPPAKAGPQAKPTVRCERCGRHVPYDPRDITPGHTPEVRICRGAEWHSVKGAKPPAGAKPPTPGKP